LRRLTVKELLWEVGRFAITMFAFGAIVTITNYLYRVRLWRLRMRILHIDLLEALHCETPEEYEAFLRRKWVEQDELLRWRILRFLDSHPCSLLEGEERWLEDNGKRMVRDPYVLLEGTIKREWKFWPCFPFLKTQRVWTEISLTDFRYPRRLITILDPSIELVKDIADMKRAKAGLGNFY
jgi:hypothetical protein